MKYAETVRAPQQVAFDLAKALVFSVAELKAFRRGMLPTLVRQVLMWKVLQPLLVASGLIVVPLLVAGFVTSRSHDCSWAQAFVILFSTVGHIREFGEANGWFRTVLYFVVAIILLALGIYQAARTPLDLLADILSRRVQVLEGRVCAREEEKHVRGKRDEVVRYFFDMKDRHFEVPRKAFLAIDDGALYRVYFLPRSQRLLAIEPSIVAKEAEQQAGPQRRR